MSVLVVIHMGLLGFEQRGKARGFRGLTLGREADDGLHVGGGCIVPGALEAVVAVGHQCHAGLALGGKDGGVAGGALGGHFLPRVVGDVDHHGLVSRLRYKQEALLLLAEPPLYGLWTGLLTAAIILFNFAGVWAMARMLLPKLLGRRGRALVSAVDNWIKK